MKMIKEKTMDESDIFDYIVEIVDELDNSDLAKLADYSLPTDWFTMPRGQTRDSVVDQITTVIYSKYFDSGAADDWGPNTYANWYIGGALDAQQTRSVDFVEVGEMVIH